MKGDNTCPKCGAKIKTFYLKQNCPGCGVDLLYYKLDERLEADAAEAERQMKKVERFLNTVKSSAVASPFHIIRLILFFTPLASMCLPMYGEISLITLVMGLIKGETEFSSVIMPLVSMVLVIVLSLAVITASLFSVTKSGFLRNMIFSGVNTVVFVVLGLMIGNIGIGWYITLAIYAAEIVMHIICKRKTVEAA